MHALDLMRAAENIFVEFGGHAAAGGFTAIPTEIFFLEERLVTAYERVTANATLVDDLSSHADAVVTPDEITESLLRHVERLAPFGQMNPKPVFLLRDVVAREITHFGKSEEHLKIKIASERGRTLDAVTFFAKGALARTAAALASHTPVHLLAHLERDTFSRGNPVRLRLLDIRVV